MEKLLKILDYQDRKLMNIEADDYLFILKEFHRLLRRSLNTTAYALFCAIEDHAGPGESKNAPAYTCTASHTTLAGEINVKRLTVQRTIKMLEEAMLIQVEDRKGETDHIRPIVTSEQRAAFLLIGKGVKATCIKKIQATYPNLFQNDTRDMTTCIFLIQPPVSKRYTNGTNLKQEDKTLSTDVLNGAEAPSSASATDSESIENETETEQNQPEAANVITVPPPDSRGLNKKRWRADYEAVQDDFKARSGVMGDLWMVVTGIPPDYKRLNRMAKDFNSMWAVCEGILKMANCEVMDDPLVYLRKVLSNGTNTGRTDRGGSERGTGKNGQNPAPGRGKPSEFESGFWDKPDAKERAEAAWSV